MGPARRQPSLRALGAGVREFCFKVQRPESYSEPNTSHSHSLLQPHDVQTNLSGPFVAYDWAANFNRAVVILLNSIHFYPAQEVLRPSVPLPSLE